MLKLVWARLLCPHTCLGSRVFRGGVRRARLLLVSEQVWSRGSADGIIPEVRACTDLRMALLMEHQFRQLPADRQVETRPFLEAVSYLPPLFGK